jgi:8-oxo-dGTP diphosphatase
VKLATLIYIRHEGKTLMVYRNKKPNDMHMGKWNGMGGKLEPGESPEECAVREAREETGLELVEPRLAGFITFPAFDDIEDWYVFLFSATEFSGELIDSPEGRLEWIPDSQLLALNLCQVRVCRWENDKVQRRLLRSPLATQRRKVYEGPPSHGSASARTLNWRCRSPNPPKWLLQHRLSRHMISVYAIHYKTTGISKEKDHVCQFSPSHFVPRHERILLRGPAVQ